MEECCELCMGIRMRAGKAVLHRITLIVVNRSAFSMSSQKTECDNFRPPVESNAPQQPS